MPGTGTASSTVLNAAAPPGGFGGAATTISFRVGDLPPDPGSALPTQFGSQFLKKVVMFLTNAISEFSPGLSYICGFILFQPGKYFGFTAPGGGGCCKFPEKPPLASNGFVFQA